MVTHYKEFNMKLYEDLDLVLVLLGSRNAETRFSESIALIEWAIELLQKK